MVDRNFHGASAGPLPIRAVGPDDLPALKAVIDATGLFPSELLDSMLAGHLDGSEPEAVGLTATDGPDGRPVAVAYCAPERMASGTWNLLLIAFHPEWQRRGHGTALITYLEVLLAGWGERILLVETSSTPAFERTRTFYARRGYGAEARVRDFYQAGEHKVIYRKALADDSRGGADGPASVAPGASGPRQP